MGVYYAHRRVQLVQAAVLLSISVIILTFLQTNTHTPCMQQYTAPPPAKNQISSKRPQTQYGMRCASGVAKALADTYDPTHNTKCPRTGVWKKALLDSSWSRSKATIVSVGCNKGDDLVADIRAWSNDPNYTTSVLHTGLTRECPWEKEPDLDPVRTTRTVSSYCIEPMETTVAWLRGVFDANTWNVTLIQAAMGAIPAVVQFPRGQLGVESLGIGSDAPQGTVDVPVITLDSLSLEEVDMLFVDTEGNDMRVIVGGIHTLPKVRYLEFEYHSTNHWATANLQDLIDLLDQFDFDCYWAGNTGQLWRLTGCWDDSYYNKRHWSNVACGRRSEEALMQAMRAASSLGF